MMLFSILTIAHVTLTTLGYTGLIVANVWLLTLLRGQQPAVATAAIRTWRRSAQVFGPLLGTGVLLGFGVASVVRAPLASSWLIATYVLIAFALGTQAAIMIPWQLRANTLVAQGAPVPTRPVVVVLMVLLVVYATILSLMVLRPT